MRRALTLALFATLTACSGGDDGDGTTTPTGDDGVANIEGSVFALDISELSVANADEALSDVISLFFSGTIVLHTHQQDGTGVKVQMGYAEADGSQDVCAPTSNFPNATFTGNDFDFGPSDTTINTTTTSFQVLGMSGGGTVSADGQSLDDLELQGKVDLRQAVGFAGFDDVTDLCDTFSNLDLDCGDCGDGSISCVDLELVGMRAVRDTYEFTSISQSDAAANCPTR